MRHKRLLLIAHAPSKNTFRLRDALLEGATGPEIEDVEVVAQSPFDTTPEHVLSAAALLLFTPENLGYMSGALKDFFDRCYYPCLDRSDGLPYALCVRAGHDGTGTCRAVASIAGGLRWRAVQEPLICRGPFQESFLEKCHELGMLMSAGLEAGIF